MVTRAIIGLCTLELLEEKLEAISLDVIDEDRKRIDDIALPNSMMVNL